MKRSIYEGYKSLYNKFHGAKTVSDFQTTGRMTAKEFVEAGDELTQVVPVWQWVGGPPKVQEYLPENKKCLVYRGAPCTERAPTIDPTSVVTDAVDEDGFVVTEAPPPQEKLTLKEEKVLTWDDDDDDSGDDDAASKDSDAAPARPREDSTQRRLYDVYIVYDKYYETPRIYLVGYSSDRITPLTTDQMKEDVYHSNYGKTVTIDNHPVLGFPCISIHPCRHAETMQHLIQQMKQKYDADTTDTSEEQPFIFPVHRALFLFLKFIATVVPTIKYDLSSGFDL